MAFHGVAMAQGIVTTRYRFVSTMLLVFILFKISNPLSTAEELSHQLGNSGTKLVFTVEMFLPKVKEAVEITNKAAGKTVVEEIFVISKDKVEGASHFPALLNNNGENEPLPPKPDNVGSQVVVMPYSSVWMKKTLSLKVLTLCFKREPLDFQKEFN